MGTRAVNLPCSQVVWTGASQHGRSTLVFKMTPVFTARQHGSHFEHPCWPAVNGYCVPTLKVSKSQLHETVYLTLLQHTRTAGNVAAIFLRIRCTIDNNSLHVSRKIRRQYGRTGTHGARLQSAAVVAEWGSHHLYAALVVRSRSTVIYMYKNTTALCRPIYLADLTLFSAVDIIVLTL